MWQEMDKYFCHTPIVGYFLVIICHNYTEIKYVKDVSCVGHSSSANLVTNVPTVAIDSPVGAKLHSERVQTQLNQVHSYK